MLMFAASSGNLNMVQCLVENGANLDIQNEYGWTALMRATMENHIDIVRYLLDKGADVNMKTNVSSKFMFFYVFH